MEYTKEELLVLSKAPNIDINKSVNFMGNFGLADAFGSRKGFETPEEFLAELQSMSKVNLKGFSYKEPNWVSGDNVEVTVTDSKNLKDEVDTIVPEEVEVVSEGLTEAYVDVVEEDVEPKLEVDWEWVDSLEDSPENRLALDEYAEKFSVKLKRTMKLSNMSKKFKEALAK